MRIIRDCSRTSLKAKEPTGNRDVADEFERCVLSGRVASGGSPNINKTGGGGPERIIMRESHVAIGSAVEHHGASISSTDIAQESSPGAFKISYAANEVAARGGLPCRGT